jgi:hypothetical protein
MDPKLRQAAEQAAAKDHRPLSSLVKKLLSDHCEGQQARTEALPPLKRARK